MFPRLSPLPVCNATHNHNNTMTTHQVIDKALSHKNWTGHSLADLIDAGRLEPKIENVMSFIRAACGEAENVETLKTYWQAARHICGVTAA